MATLAITDNVQSDVVINFADRFKQNVQILARGQSSNKEQLGGPGLSWAALSLKKASVKTIKHHKQSTSVPVIRSYDAAMLAIKYHHGFCGLYFAPEE
jgi:hypothetical protein